MKFRGLIVAAVVIFGLALVLDSNTRGGDKEITVKLVMQKAMKGGLCGKVAKGEASDAEKKQLVELFTGLSKIPCPKGDEKDWKARTSALLAAAKADDGKALKKAADCKGCHSAHK